MLGQIVDALQLHEMAGDYESEPVFLGPILEDLTQEFCWPARSKDISLRIAPSRAAVFSHPVLLRGIFRNLLRNALDYTPPGGRVVMTCRRHTGGLRVNISDTGIGIRRTALAQIFTAFAREDTSRVDGLGLGLFIVKCAADLLQHRIEVRSVQGRGSCFTMIAEPADFTSGRKPRNEHRKSGMPSLYPGAIVTELYPCSDPPPSAKGPGTRNRISMKSAPAAPPRASAKSNSTI
jgi:K+-sensing histidine kinase KdpD